MEGGPAKDRALEAGLGEIGVLDAGLREVGALEVGFVEIDWAPIPVRVSPAQYGQRSLDICWHRGFGRALWRMLSLLFRGPGGLVPCLRLGVLADEGGQDLDNRPVKVRRVIG